MDIQLITATKEQISPEVISDNLQRVVDMMADSDMKNRQTIYIYNILYAACSLLKRYETVCRGTLFAATVEEDGTRLREHIINLQQNALYQKLFVVQAVSEEADI